MAKRVGIISINLQAGTAQFQADMAKAKASVRDFGTEAKKHSESGISEMRATSAAFKTLEGHITNNFRAADAFAEHMLGLGPILQKAFPLVGAIAFAGMLYEIGQKAYEFWKKMQEGPERVANAFREMNAPLRITNDELRVTNDRLDNDIAKLEGHRQNTLKLALDEARLAADKLAESIEKDLKSLNKLLKEENINAFEGFFTHQASTSKLRDYLGGETGIGGVYAQIADIDDEGRAKFDAAKTQKEKTAVATELETERQKKLAEAIQFVNTQLSGYNALQAQRTKALAARAKGDLDPGGVPADQAKAIELARGALRVLRNTSELSPLSNERDAKTARKEALEAANANAKLGQPYADKLKALQADLAGVTGKLAAAGQSQSAKVMAAAFGEAVKTITEVNKALEEHHGKLTKTQEATIRFVSWQIAAGKAETEWQAKLATTSAEFADRIKAQELLTAAIGKGYEATKKANTETLVMSKVGGERYNDPEWMRAHSGDVSRIRTGAGQQFDAEHTYQTTLAIDQLNDQIELEKNLAAVQAKGAEAIRLVTLAYRLRELASKGATHDQIAAEIELFNATKTNTSAAGVARLNAEIAATQRLTEAQIKGAEAARLMNLELKYEQMRRDLGTSAGADAEIAAQRAKDTLDHQAAITSEVVRTVNADRDRLAELDEQKKALEALKGAGADELGIRIKLRDIENERLDIQARQLLQFGSARDGLRAFFLEMRKSVESEAQILFDALTQGVDRLSHNLAMLATRGKTDFGQMFKDIGTRMIEDSAKKALMQGLGALSKTPLGQKATGALDKLGIHLPGTKMDGQARSSALWVQLSAGTAGDHLDSTVDRIHGLLQNKAGDPTGAQGNPFYVYVLNKAPQPGVASEIFKTLGALVPFLGALGGSAGGGGGGSSTSSVSTAPTESVTSSVSYGGAEALGGPVSPGKAYLVGENGPEILTGASGRIHSNAESRRMLDGAAANHYYSIDARGTDPALTEMRVRSAIVASHNSAVKTSVLAQNERMHRTPQRF